MTTAPANETYSIEVVSDGPTDDHGRPLTGWGIYALVALMTCDEIGHTCSRDGCLEVARHLVPWPGHAPIRLCDGHASWTLHVAGALGMEQIIRLGTRALEVKRRNAEPEDESAARFAAMELT